MASEAPLARTMTARDVSVTERGTFKSCRRRWMVDTLWNWAPKQPVTALAFGDGIHQALEVYYEAKKDLGSDFDRQETLEDALDTLQEWNDTAAQAQAEFLGALFTSEARQELYDLYLLGRTMLTNYAIFDEEQDRRDPWEIVAIEGRGLDYDHLCAVMGSTPPYLGEALPRFEEGRVVIPIVDPDTGEVHPSGACLSARLDLLVRRGTRGDLWVADHKTSATAPSDRGIDFEDQITGYCYAVWRLTGLRPRGTIYNYLVKQVPKDPRIIRVTKKNPDGELSTAKDQLCLPSDYRQEMLDRGLMMSSGTIVSEDHAACYDAMLAKGWNPYFRRLEVQRNEHEILNFERRLWREYEDMADVAAKVLAGDTGAAYPNLSSWHCPGCPVGPVCQAMEDGSDVEGILEARYVQAPDRKAAR